jgi:ketosteroid isomerase-like protein
MSQENLDAVRGAYEALNQGNAEAVLGAIHDEMEFREPESLPYGGTYRGPQGMGELFEALASNWDELHLEIEQLLDAGDWAVVLGRLQGRSKATGEQVDEPYVEVLRFRDGKAIEGRIQMDTTRVLRALGVEATAAA